MRTLKIPVKKIILPNEAWAVQKHANLVDLVKSFPTSIQYCLLAKSCFDTAEIDPLKVLVGGVLTIHKAKFETI